MLTDLVMAMDHKHTCERKCVNFATHAQEAHRVVAKLRIGNKFLVTMEWFGHAPGPFNTSVCRYVRK